MGGSCEVCGFLREYCVCGVYPRSPTGDTTPAAIQCSHRWVWCDNPDAVETVARCTLCGQVLTRSEVIRILGEHGIKVAPARAVTLRCKFCGATKPYPGLTAWGSLSPQPGVSCGGPDCAPF
jgi:hypothetical protein